MRSIWKKAGVHIIGVLLLLGVLTAALALCVSGKPESVGFFGGQAQKEAAVMAAQPEKVDDAGTSSKAKAADIPYVARENRQPVISMGQNAGTIYISWKGNADGPRYLRFAEDKYDLPTAQSIKAHRTKILKGDYYRYKVELSGLEKGQLYFYEIGDGTVFDSPGFFYAPEEAGETVFAYFGDPQFNTSLGDYEDWNDLVWEMYKTNNDVDFAIAGGDLINSPTQESHWNGFLDSCGLFSTIPLMTIPGNHEGVTSNATYKKLFQHISNGPDGEAFYYFDYGNCRFIMLDSSFLTKARQKAMGKALWSAKERDVESWLRRVLADSNRSWNIVVTHHPIYGMHDIFTVSPKLRELWLPIMEEGGVDLVLCGHQHTYMRSSKIDGIVHVMGNSGGKRSNYYRGLNRPNYAESIYAAGSNYQVIRATKTKLELTSYDSDNTIIDSFKLKKNRWSELF